MSNAATLGSEFRTRGFTPRTSVAPVFEVGALLGDELARMQPSLLRLARGITHDEDAAADVVQSAFLKVLLHVNQFERRASLRTWVWRIAANEALQWSRARGRFESKIAAFAEHVSLSSMSQPPSPFDALERRRAVDRLGAALAKLSQRDRNLIERTFAASGSATPRPSTQTAVSQRTLRTRLHRARQRLRSVLEAER